MNSYTYKPAIGITSETGPNGKTNIYEYDTLGRLLDIKDQDGNIIKTFEYHYKSAQ
jgi:YD repeat-containing protein